MFETIRKLIDFLDGIVDHSLDILVTIDHTLEWIKQSIPGIDTTQYKRPVGVAVDGGSFAMALTYFQAESGVSASSEPKSHPSWLIFELFRLVQEVIRKLKKV